MKFDTLSIAATLPLAARSGMPVVFHDDPGNRAVPI